MSTCMIRLDKQYDCVDAMLSRLKAELNMMRRFNMHCAKIVHGGSGDSAIAELRMACRQYLHERMAEGEIRAICIGEHFGPFEHDGRQIAALNHAFRQDPDWSRSNDAITIIVV